jgi:hypothetical protein
MRVPLEMRGVISIVNTRKPTKKELDECECIKMTSDVPWFPYSSNFDECEEHAKQCQQYVQAIESNRSESCECPYTRTIEVAELVHPW